jgi:hypothetical protein
MRRADESGFALLLVFLMASIVAIGLYYELPRVAMESQRQKEQLLIERGEQYKRAIQLFFKKAGRYPGEIKDLESFQNQRFLRRRYIDPMTGKDEWRLIHIQNGVLTDSLVNKQKGQGDQPSTLGQYIGMQPGALDAQGPQGGALSPKDRRRASDSANPTMTGPDGQPQPTMQGAQPFPNGGPDPNVPQNVGLVIPGGQFNPATGGGPQIPGLPPGVVFPGQNLGPNGGQFGVQPGLQPGGQPGLPRPFPMPQPPAQGGNPGGSFIGAQPFMGGSQYVGGGMPGSNPGGAGQQPIPGQPFPGLPFMGQPNPGQPGAPVNSPTGGISPYPPQPGMATGVQDPNTAAGMLNRILTTPRPGGMPQPGGQTIGGGMAGVASTGEGEGVMIYNDRTLYKEWEFIFDPSKVKPLQNPNAMTATPTGMPAGQMGSMPAPSGMSPVGGGTLNQNPAGATPTPGSAGPRPGQQ